MYTTGNHIADGDYSAHVARMEEHARQEEDQGYYWVIDNYGGEVDNDIDEAKIHLATMQVELRNTSCPGKIRAYEEIINQIKAKHSAL